MTIIEIKLTIPGKPIGKARPRVTRHGTYTPEKTKIYEKRVQDLFAASRQPPITDGTLPLSATVYAHFEPPKSCSKRKRNELDGTPYTKKPDADNIAKAILDALNGVAYPDDAQIAWLAVEKVYDTNNYAEVVIKQKAPCTAL